MSKECEIVQDLLPLYVDNVCSKSSVEMVREHLLGCQDCLEVHNRMKNKNCEGELRRETESIIMHHAREQKKKTFMVGSCIAGILCIPVIVCLIVNLAVGHALDWFFIVLTSLMVFASLVVVPLVAKKQKGLCTIISFTISLMLLLFTCAVYVKGDWFWIVESSVLFGLSVVFLPYILNKAPMGSFSKCNKGLIYFSVNTGLLIFMLCCIGIYVQDPIYWETTPPIVLYTLGAVWAVFLVCRYLKLSKEIRAGIASILIGVFLFSVDYVIDLILGNNPSWPRLEWNSWNIVTADGNMKVILLVISSIIGITLICTGYFRGKKQDKAST